jgi:hypothetical protein
MAFEASPRSPTGKETVGGEDFLPCFCLVFALFLPCFCLVFALFLPCFCLVLALF